VRAAATFLVVLGALLALPAAALATDQVVVQPEGANARTVSLTALGDPDVQGREYETGAGRAALTGWSLDRVLDAANVNPYRFGDVEIAAAGTSVTLDRDEFLDPGAFPDGPPVFWMPDGMSRFLRPVSASGGPTQVGGGGLITVRLSRLSRLSVSAAASKTRLDPGERVTFTAAVEGAAQDEPVAISWYFDDRGDRVSGARVTHRFRKPGTYVVLVSATTADDDPGADDFVRVRIRVRPTALAVGRTRMRTRPTAAWARARPGRRAAARATEPPGRARAGRATARWTRTKPRPRGGARRGAAHRPAEWRRSGASAPTRSVRLRPTSRTGPSR